MDATDWGIPTLDLSYQATEIVPPVYPYGSVPRTRAVGGSVHFYVADHKFTRLFANPLRVLLTGCQVAFEPNCTTGPTVPRAASLFGIYRKRATAIAWQRYRIKVVVDLNVCDDSLDLALLGVPAGWRAYSVRAHRGDTPADHERRHRMATERAGSDDVLFVVVGGGKRTKALCVDRGWVHVPEHCRVVRGGEIAYGGVR